MTEEVMDLNGAQTITISAGTISANGFTSPTIYVDGKVSSTLPDTNWHHIAITTDTDVDASAVVIGKVGADYFTGALDNVQLYAYARTADEIRLDYNAGTATHLGPSGKTCSEDPAGCMDYGLVGYWSFDEGTGTTAYDSSDEGNDGSLGGGTASKMPKWTAGHSVSGGHRVSGGAGALQFDGENDYVDCGSDESLNITDAITIEAWVYTRGHSAYMGILNKWDWTGGGHRSYGLIITSANVFRMSLSSDGTDDTRVICESSAISATTDQWYHVVGSYGGTDIVLYVNAILVDSDQFTGPIHSSPNSALIGAYDLGNTAYFDGIISEVRIYNRALSAEEIRYHYNRGGPVAHWKFDEGSGQTAHDSAGDADAQLGSDA
ncbi:MAG: hypothetical protein DRO40_09710, partial [Thermoprotei archaeon]